MGERESENLNILGRAGFGSGLFRAEPSLDRAYSGLVSGQAKGMSEPDSKIKWAIL